MSADSQQTVPKSRPESSSTLKPAGPETLKPRKRLKQERIYGLRNEKIALGYISQGGTGEMIPIAAPEFIPDVSSRPGCVTFAAVTLDEPMSSETLSAHATLFEELGKGGPFRVS